MQIIQACFKPFSVTIHFLKETTVMVIHGVAARIFTSVHLYFIRGKKADEIINLTRAIHLLEERKDCAEIFAQIPTPFIFDKPPKKEHLLESLKIHRYSLKALWKGVSQNKPLCHQIYHYQTALPANSPYKKNYHWSNNPTQPLTPLRSNQQ